MSQPNRQDFYDVNESTSDKSSIGETAAKEVKDIRNKIVDATSRMRDQTSQMASTLSDTVEHQRENAADTLESAASTLHEKASDIPGGPKIQGIADSVADGMESLADYVRDATMTDLKDAALETFRKYPTQTLVSALIVGYLAGRMIRR